MVSVTEDIAWDTPLADFLSILHKTGGRLGQYNPHGPGGGNPEVTVEFLDQASADIYSAWYNGNANVISIVD